MFAGLVPVEPKTHDAVVLLADDMKEQVFLFAAKQGLIPDLARFVKHPWDWSRLSMRYEYPMPGSAFECVDLALLVDGCAVCLLEIKSAPEAQTASGWYRQIRNYVEMSGFPCMLVIAHDLREEHYEYLQRVGVTVCDLRTLGETTTKSA